MIYNNHDNNGGGSGGLSLNFLYLRDRADRAAAHLDGAGRREGRSAVTSTAGTLIHHLSLNHALHLSRTCNFTLHLVYVRVCCTALKRQAEKKEPPVCSRSSLRFPPLPTTHPLVA